MSCTNGYKKLCSYNDNRLLIIKPLQICNSAKSYNSYDLHYYKCCDNICKTKGTVTFKYTPESDSCWKNTRCCL